MDWYELTDRYNARAIASPEDLLGFPHAWQREVAALGRLESDVNNGAYLQFIGKWGIPSSEYAIAGLLAIGAERMQRIIEECQQLVLDATDPSLPDRERFQNLMRNAVIHPDGRRTPPRQSILPDRIFKRIYDLSYQFMDYPDDVPALGLAYYLPLVEADV